MSSKKDWLDDVADVLRLPRVVAERCVHDHIETACCQRCVERCPRDAWVMDEEQLGIDTERCDGCGLCVPACPGQAIVQERFPLEREWAGRSIAMAVCERAADVPEHERGDAETPCLNAFGVYDLLRLYRNGVRHWLVCHGDCSACPRHVDEGLERLVRRVNRLLRSRGLPRIAWSSLPPAQWRGAKAKTRQWQGGRRFGRRGFFGSLLAHGMEQDWGESDGQPRQALPPGRYLPVPDAGRPALYFHAPRLLEESCNGCDACVRLCPQQALLYDEAGQAYLIQANDCDGCGICVDACAENAITLDAWRELPQPAVRVPLRNTRCRSCGNPYHLPVAHDDAGQCPVCARVNHQRNLFQVLDPD